MGGASTSGGGFNAAADLLERNLKAGRGDKIAIIDEAGSYSYQDVDERARRFANVLIAAGVEPEQRVLLCLLDSIDFPTCFLGAILAGAVPVPVNTLLTAADYDFMLEDSRAKMLVVSDLLFDRFAEHLAGHGALKTVLVSGGEGHGQSLLSDALATAQPSFETAPTLADEICFWLYTSGTTGQPKASVHLHSDLIKTAELYAIPTLAISEADVVYSAAKLFFAYGLGNALTFPFAVGATAVLIAGRPTPEAVVEQLLRHQPTIFYGVPTLFAMLLAGDALPEPAATNLRLCVSAGEALPADLLRRWQDRMGTDILDGIGSTEMLHIFISNRPGDVRPGSSGKVVPGYEARLIGDDGAEVATGEIGNLQIAGPTSATCYWNRREQSLKAFEGPWTNTGDKYIRDADGYYIYCGRSDDMMKVGGIYVSPFEVEEALIAHEATQEAAVVGAADGDGLIKPKAYVVLKANVTASEALADELQAFVKERLASFKYPRWVEFIDELPKTATGKIQRFKLRESP